MIDFRLTEPLGQVPGFEKVLDNVPLVDVPEDVSRFVLDVVHHLLKGVSLAI